MEAKPILVVGSAALDTLETPMGNEEDALGGSSFYFSTAASLLAPVRLVAVIGNDFPMEKIAFLKDRNVDLDGLIVEDGATFRWGGRYHEDPNKRDTLFTELGVFEHFDPKIPEHFKNTPLIFLGNIQPALQLKVLDQIENPELVVLDTMNLWIDITPDDLEKAIRRVDVLILNDEEALQLTGKFSLLDAADDLFSRGLQKIIVKKGQHGAVLFEKEGGIFFVPAYPLRKVKDATGAGDTFAAGMMGYLANHDLNDFESWRQAIVYGTITASFVCEEFSMRKTCDLTPEKLEERIAEFRKMTQF